MPRISKESMIERTPLLVGAAGLVASAIILLVTPTTVEICQPDGRCDTFTREEYRLVKAELADLVEVNGPSEPLTWEKYQALVKIVDREIKANGSLKISNVRGEDDIKNAINSLLRR